MRSVVIIISSLLLLIANHVAAEARYVGDSIFVPVRSGPSNGHRIIHRGLKTGARVQVIGAEENGFINIKMPSGKNGWMETQYLSRQPAAKDRLIKVAKENEALKEKNISLAGQLSELTEMKKSVDGESSFLASENQRLKQELQDIKKISANALQLDKDVERLRLENAEFKNQIDLVTSKNQRLIDDKSNESFLNGAIAVVIGVFITLIVPRLWPQKKQSDWF